MMASPTVVDSSPAGITHRPDVLSPPSRSSQPSRYYHSASTLTRRRNPVRRMVAQARKGLAGPPQAGPAGYPAGQPGGDQARSNRMAIPWPPPMHMVATA